MGAELWRAADAASDCAGKVDFTQNGPGISHSLNLDYPVWTGAGSDPSQPEMTDTETQMAVALRHAQLGVRCLFQQNAKVKDQLATAEEFRKKLTEALRPRVSLAPRQAEPSETPPRPAERDKTSPGPTMRSETPPRPTKRDKTSPGPTERSKTPPRPTKRAKTLSRGSLPEPGPAKRSNTSHRGCSVCAGDQADLDCFRCNATFIHRACTMLEDGSPLGWCCGTCSALAVVKVKAYGVMPDAAQELRSLPQKERLERLTKLEFRDWSWEFPLLVERQLYVTADWSDGTRTVEPFGETGLASSSVAHPLFLAADEYIRYNRDQVVRMFARSVAEETGATVSSVLASVAAYERT